MSKPLPAHPRRAHRAPHGGPPPARRPPPLGSDEYRAACEEIAAIEIRIAEIEQPARAPAG